MSGNCCSPNGTCHTSDAPAADAQETVIAVTDAVTAEGDPRAELGGAVQDAARA